MMEIIRAAEAAQANPPPRDLESDNDADPNPSSLTREQESVLASLLEDVQPFLTTHLMPCMGLGTGFGTLDDKLHAWLFACRLECSTWEKVESFCNSIVSLTTDWGTESGLADAPRIDYDTHFPFWSDKAFFDEEAEALDGGAYFDEDVAVAGLNVVDGQPPGS
jgi:hypothetical protein